MVKWKSETGANGICYWINLSDNIELSIFRKNINDSVYLYRLGGKLTAECTVVGQNI